MANSIKNLIKTGFGLGIGVYAAQLVFLLLGMIVFFPAYVSYKEKQKANASDSQKIMPFVFMILGVVLMGGAGFGILADSAGDFFD